MTASPGPGADRRPPQCDDPRHDDGCDCGARPDFVYESRIEVRL